MEKIIQNAIKIVDEGEIIYLPSLSRHDFRTYTFKNGESVSVDGGVDYCRRAYITKDNWLDWSLTEIDNFETVCHRLLWGTYGKNGDEPLKYLPLCELEKSHLESILKTQKVGALYEKVIKHLLKHG